jgi:hypothetical protein
MPAKRQIKSAKLRPARKNIDSLFIERVVMSDMKRMASTVSGRQNGLRLDF